MKDWKEELKDKWIYESPDRGKTVYRRRFFADYTERELIKSKNI